MGMMLVQLLIEAGCPEPLLHLRGEPHECPVKATWVSVCPCGEECCGGKAEKEDQEG